MNEFIIEWPYPVNYGKVNRVETDVLVAGGGIAGSWAAITAAKRGVKVAVVDQMDVFSAGPAGCDHWLHAYDNPACKIKPDEAIQVAERLAGGYINGVGMYITYNESYKTLLELERMGAKVRDTDDEFKGAPFRDEDTKLLYAYDYEVRDSIRVWGQTFKQALYEQLMRLKVPLYGRIKLTSLLTEESTQRSKVVGAMGVNIRTGEFYIFKAKATILSTGSRDGSARIWGYGGFGFTTLSAPLMTGGGHIMAWNAGAELSMLHTRAWAGTAHGGMPSYLAVTPTNTWYPCSIVDAQGKEVPWIDTRTGMPLSSFEERTHPSLRGYKQYGLAYPIYQVIPQVISPDFLDRVKRGEFTLPLYADLPGMPEHERRVIFGLMMPGEGKTWILYRNLTQAGFDPDKDMLQGYRMGLTYREGRFDKGRSLDPVELGDWACGASGGLVHDWNFKASLEGLYVAGDALFMGTGHSGAVVSGRWAGAKAADYAKQASFGNVSEEQVESEMKRVYASTERKEGLDWKDLNVAISKIMRTYCSDLINEEMLKIALKWLDELEEGEAQKLVARNPHELARTLETMDVLANAKLWILACQSRKPGTTGFTVMKQRHGKVEVSELPLRWWLKPPYAPTYRENYEKHKPW
jgi:succinate dehydrogenase/fumarate reductase flavoprotein subunit